MTAVTIRGVTVNFPFPPYDIQVNYMDKVLECLQDRKNGVLESPTGTGKTLSLLCSTLAWLELKKGQVQAERHKYFDENEFLKELNAATGCASKVRRNFLGLPTIIYASRTHSQLSQAMQELKGTSYKHVKAVVLGSREQMCVNEDVQREENNAMKIQLCRMKVKERSCFYHSKVEKKKDDDLITQLSVIDIEDIVKLGQTQKFCPYFMTKHLKDTADIIFTPYNYLLDPRARKSLGVELGNNIIILDEGHNVEKTCEESASMQLKSTDITLCIDEVTSVMKAFSEDNAADFSDKETPNDFTADELCFLKEIFLKFEKVLDDVELRESSPEGTCFDGNYIFEMLEGAGISDGNFSVVVNLIDKITQFLAVANSGPFSRKGAGLQLFADLLSIAFANSSPQFKEKIQHCYKVHITAEEPRKKVADNWLSKATAKGKCRVLSYWCFSPGFGMNMLLNQSVHCVILTSGTLAPLMPLISELDLDVKVRIENPHIVQGDQVCVKILSKGPDGEPLICNFQNRSNLDYLTSLGQSISNLIRFIPDGVLVFFPSYPIMLRCQQHWQESGIWGSITNIKPIYVEPRDKKSFNAAMEDYYAKIKDPAFQGAIFMGVCRGKVSEGLDFADANGRAVFIIGLPYPPLKDAKIILKKRYLDICNAKNKDFLKGDEWYTLEATRAVNQAIGRVIRHKNDYGAIILLDSRFTNLRIQNNMSLWLRKHIRKTDFREAVRDLREFFRVAEGKFATVAKAQPEIKTTVTSSFFNFSGSASGNSTQEETSLVNIHKRKADSLSNILKKKKIVVVSRRPTEETSIETTMKNFINMVKTQLNDAAAFHRFVTALANYRAASNFEALTQDLDKIFLGRFNLLYLILGIEPYIKDDHKERFQAYYKRISS